MAASTRVESSAISISGKHTKKFYQDVGKTMNYPITLISDILRKGRENKLVNFSILWLIFFIMVI